VVRGVKKLSKGNSSNHRAERGQPAIHLAQLRATGARIQNSNRRTMALNPYQFILFVRYLRIFSRLVPDSYLPELQQGKLVPPLIKVSVCPLSFELPSCPAFVWMECTCKADRGLNLAFSGYESYQGPAGSRAIKRIIGSEQPLKFFGSPLIYLRICILPLLYGAEMTSVFPLWTYFTLLRSKHKLTTNKKEVVYK